MKKIFVSLIALVISSYTLSGCSNNNSNNSESEQINAGADSTVAFKNYINTDIDEDKNGNKYISIFYSVSGLTSEEGEELNIALKKESSGINKDLNNDKIASLTFINRENTKIEQIDLKNTEKVQKILTSLKELKADNSNDKKAINTAINLLTNIK